MTHHPPIGMGRGDSVVRTSLAIGVDDVRSIRDLGASAKRKESQPSSSFKKQKTSLLHESQGQGRSHQGKAKVNHPGIGDTSRLLASQGRERVSIVSSLDTLNGIALKGRDPRNTRHHSPNHQWDMLKRSLFLLTPA